MSKPKEYSEMTRSRFQVYKDAAGKFRFRLRAENDKIVATGEAYEQHASCINGIKSIQKNCNSETEDLTIEDRKVPNPKYQIFKDAADKYRFHLKAANGEIIAQSEGYLTKEDCLNGVEVVKNSCDAEIEDESVVTEPSGDKVSRSETEDLVATPKPIEAETKTASTGAKPKEYSEMTQNKLMTYTFISLLILTVVTVVLWSTEKTPSGWNLGLTLAIDAIIAVGIAVGLDAFLYKVTADSPLNLMSAAVFGLIVTNIYSLGVPAMRTIELFPLEAPQSFIYVALISVTGIVLFKKIQGLAGRKYVNPAAAAKLVVTIPFINTLLIAVDHLKSSAIGVPSLSGPIGLVSAVKGNGLDGFGSYVIACFSNPSLKTAPAINDEQFASGHVSGKVSRLAWRSLNHCGHSRWHWLLCHGSKIREMENYCKLPCDCRTDVIAFVLCLW